MGCAAPKLLQKGGADGHKVKSMSEKWFSPMGPTVSVTYSHDGKMTTKVFNTGDSVPSCEECQELLPEMLCDNDGECG